MSKLTAIMPFLLLLLLSACGGASDSSDKTETESESITTQTTSPSSEVSRLATDGTTANADPSDQAGNDTEANSTPKENTPTEETSIAPNDSSATKPEADNTVPQDKSPGLSSDDSSAVTPNGVPEDTTIVPGEQLGPVTLDTTYTDLVEAFGDSRLSNTDVHLGEGFMAPGTRVDLGNDYSFSVVWTDSDRTAPMEIRDLGPGWQTPEGIHHGMTFNQLEGVLGSFELLGFGWDYGGTVILDNTTLNSYSGKMFIRVGPSTSDWETKNAQLLKVSGDQAFSSTNPNFDGLDIAVYDLVVRLNTP